MNSRQLTIMILVLIGLAGCGRDGFILTPSVDKRGYRANTPDQLITQVATAYLNRDLEVYQSLLTEDFVFSMKPCDINELGKGPDAVMWGKEEELKIAGRMFSGKACTNSAGVAVPAILSISVDRCAPLITWEAAGERDHPFVLRAVYDMRVEFTLADGRVLVVDGPTTFYAAPVTLWDGEVVYKLRGWVDKS